MCMLNQYSRVRHFEIPWTVARTVARQAPLSMGFSRQEYWSRLPYPPSGDLPDPEIELVSPASPALQAYSLPLATGEVPGLIMMVSKDGLKTAGCVSKEQIRFGIWSPEDLGDIVCRVSEPRAKVGVRGQNNSSGFGSGRSQENLTSTSEGAGLCP